MRIKLLNRTIEISNRINVHSFKNEKTLIGVSYRRKDLKSWKNIKDLFLYCFMPYTWLDKQYCQNKL